MLKELVLKDFKSFSEETVRFSPTGLTVLVGPNGCGKTSVLEGVFVAARSAFLPAPNWVDLPLNIRANRPRFELVLRTELGSESVSQQVLFAHELHTTRWHESPGTERRVTWDESMRFPVTLQERVPSGFPFPSVFEVDLHALREPLRPQAHQEFFRAPQVVQVLFDLKMGADVNALNRLVEKLRRVVPAVKGFAIQRQPEGDVDRYALSFAMSTGANLSASQVSEGTLWALSILAAAAQTTRPTVLLIDDIDRALHPTAQRELIKLLRALVAEGNLEIVCTTHSPYILSEFKYDEVRVLREVDGASRCMSLSDGPEASRWMKELDAGEYWSFIEHKLFQKSA